GWQAALAEAQQPGSALMLEITERLLLDPQHNPDASPNALPNMDIKIALDDFGTGHSSLPSLKHYHTDYLNIAQSLVEDLKLLPESMTLCRAIMVMAHQLGIRVIAEGVLGPLQHRLLRDAGCDLGQGYGYAAPISAEELESLMRQGPLAPPAGIEPTTFP